VKKILVTCGETSSELIASKLVRELRIIDPDIEILALGSSNLGDAGAEIIFRMEDYSVMGFWEVFKRLKDFLELERSLRKTLANGIDLFIPVDFPGFNLRLSRYARSIGIPVLYFISPQVWAWGGWRVREIKKNVTLMSVLFPFEEEFYKSIGMDVVLIRHPLIDIVKAPDKAKKSPGENDEFKVVLFPGSRLQEVSRMLDVLLGAARKIKKRFINARFVLGLAPLIDEKSLKLPDDMRGYLQVSLEGIKELEDASLVIASSGTVTLQSALSGTPTIVLYRTSFITYLIGKLLVKVDKIAMPNLIAGREVVPEFVQNHASEYNIAREAIDILSSPERYERISAELLELRRKLDYKKNVSDLARIALNLIG